jgi:hypothetical protein
MMKDSWRQNSFELLFQKFKILFLRVSKPVSIALQPENDTSEKVRRHSLVFAFSTLLDSLAASP